MLTRLKQITAKINGLFIILVLIIFYVLIIPAGKIMMMLGELSKRKNNDSYWIGADGKPTDLGSPY